MIRYMCPKCGEPLNVDDSRAGRPYVCPQCYSETVIPGQPAVQPRADRMARDALGLRTAWAEFKTAAQEAMVEDQPAAKRPNDQDRDSVQRFLYTPNTGRDLGFQVLVSLVLVGVISVAAWFFPMTVKHAQHSGQVPAIPSTPANVTTDAQIADAMAAFAGGCAEGAATTSHTFQNQILTATIHMPIMDRLPTDREAKEIAITGHRALGSRLPDVFIRVLVVSNAGQQLAEAHGYGRNGP